MIWKREGLLFNQYGTSLILSLSVKSASQLLPLESWKIPVGCGANDPLEKCEERNLGVSHPYQGPHAKIVEDRMCITNVTMNLLATTVGDSCRGLFARHSCELFEPGPGIHFWSPIMGVYEKVKSMLVTMMLLKTIYPCLAWRRRRLTSSCLARSGVVCVKERACKSCTIMIFPSVNQCKKRLVEPQGCS